MEKTDKSVIFFFNKYKFEVVFLLRFTVIWYIDVFLKRRIFLNFMKDMSKVVDFFCLYIGYYLRETVI